ncbi:MULTISPECIES: helix-turn-helix domain-containing transcriptional regulator [Acetobacteraceae]|jgi:DNA-binding phage protein|uniref:Addiction module antidote protein n=2 Tax=Acetobacteraceae TaxID=433 RepID=A0A6S6PVM1_ACEAC|nr:MULTISPECIES: hypothetical protein [Acetobacteraceae]PYD70703.1 addiction module antidote protein [Novacetimonas hansenii]RFP04155.1 addiction module antidote protein [Novacetimonas hansenii]WEQ60565.1 addiction module antidote protein [Novacetimonas hansenii]CUW48746.1 addiction module antidote protein [Novacetimonas hansenii]BCI69044.1 hypothetical protein AAJCM20276_36680 [Acetobacter aceti]
MKTSGLDVFDSVKAAQDPWTQEELLNMAWADGDAAAFAHALSVIARAQGADDIAKEALSGKGDLDLTGLFRVMSAFGIKVAFHTTG